MAPLLPSDPESNESVPKKVLPKLLKGAGLSIGAAAIAGTAGAGWWGWNFIQSDLAPMVQNDIQNRINRPLKIGDLESVSWGKIKFGKSVLPTHTKTVQGQVINDQDRASVDSIEVDFNPIQALTDREIDLSVTLNRPQVFLDEAPQSNWIDLQLTSPEGSSLIKTNIRNIKLKDGTVKLNPKRTDARILRNLNGEVKIDPDKPWVDLRARTQVDTGGNIDLKGRFLNKTQNLKLETKSKDLIIAPLVGILPTDLPFKISQGVLNGDVDLDYRPNKPLKVKSNIIAKNLDIYIPTQDVAVQAEQFKGKIQLFVQANTPVELKGEGQIKNAIGNLPEDLILSTGRDSRLQAEKINGEIKFLGEKQRFWSDLTGKLPEGGNVAIKGVTSFLEEKSKLNLRAQDIPAKLLDQAFGLPITVQKGRLSGNIDLNLRQGNRPSVNGTAQLKAVDFQITGIPQAFSETNGGLRLNELTTTFDDVAGKYGTIPLTANGSIDPDRGYNLQGRSQVMEINQGLKTLGVAALPIPLAGNAIAEKLSVTGEINDPILQGQFRSVDQFKFDKIPLKEISAEFNLRKPTLDISNIQAKPISGGLFKGTGKYHLTPNVPWTANIEGEGLSGNAIAALYNADPGFNLGIVSTQGALKVLSDDYQLDVDLQAPNGAFPASGRLSATPQKIDLQNIKADIPGGQLLAQGAIKDGQIDLDTQIPGLNLFEYSEALRGQLSGQLNIKSPLIGFSSKSAIAQGQLQLTEGISLIEDPIDAQVRWNGQHIEILQANAPNFQAQGIMGALLEGPTAPQLTTLDLDIKQRGYDLASLPFELPANSILQGSVDLQGRLFGQVYSPQLQGDIQVDNLAINDLDFEPLLNGTLNFATEGDLAIKASGKENKVQLTLNQVQEPKAFYVQNNGAIAIGKTVAPNQLAIDVKEVPLTAMNWDFVNDYGYGRVSGKATGQFNVALPTYNLSGPLTIQEPSIGPFKGDQFDGQFELLDGVIAIKDGSLTQNNNEFLVDTRIIPDEVNPKFSGNITIANAQVEDAIAALETLEFIQPEFGLTPNYGKAKDIQTTPVGNTSAPLILQLQRLAEINQLRYKQLELDNPIAQLPTINDLAGAVKGRVSFNGSANQGITSDFSLESAQIDWESYPLTNIVASGRYENQSVDFQKFSFDGFGGNLAFQGKIGQQNNGKLLISNLPVDEISQLFAPSLLLEGFLNAEATFQGNYENPSIAGQIKLSDASLNQSEIREAQAEFNFQQARLKVVGEVDLNNPEPIKIAGSIPYQFPFMTAQPVSDELKLRLQIKNEGLGLINLFTDQIAWEAGEGEVDVAVLGTLTQPSVQGRVGVNNATISASSLPDSLTNVSGELLFDQELVRVQNLKGNFSDGALRASGTIPLFQQARQNGQSTSIGDGVSVTLKDIALNLKGLYKGGIGGQLQITGSVMEPIVGGRVGLSNGQIVLSSATSLSNPTSQSLSQSEKTELASNFQTVSSLSSSDESNTQPLQFNDLLVQLGEKVRILQPPLLNFTAQGNLKVNGSIDSPSPEGVVNFTKGEVNLFTSIFRLNKRKENFAAFSPRYGIDPYLNVNLITILTEVNNGRSDRLNEFEDPLAGTLGSIESVRVKAAVDGRASQLLNNFEQAVDLTSNPSRSEGEILALLSGGLPEAIQDGNADLALVNIASSAVLNRVQTFVDDAFGGRAVFRLFPILIPNDAERSVLAFGSEFGYDITDDLSVSVLQVLTGTNDPTLFNISYDINERFRARGSVSIDGDATGLLEYRFRF